jgi:hypothetical protein
MDDRLIPINGVIALLRGDGGWPRLLGDQGIRRHQFEVPISTPLGDIRADALLYRKDPNLILLVEAKSGRNLDAPQAQKYVAADITWLQRAGAIPNELRSSAAISIHVLFAGREEHRPDLEAALRHLDLNASLLTVGPDRARLSGASGVAGLDDFDTRHTAGLPPARLPVDHQSPDEELRELLIPLVVAAQARQDDIVSVKSLAARIVPEWAVLSHGARQRFVGRAAELLRALARGQMRGQIRYEPVAASDMRGRIIIESTPATMDPRGRTRAWQAQQTRAGRALRRPRQPVTPGQISLDELADQGGLASD